MIGLAFIVAKHWYTRFVSPGVFKVIDDSGISVTVIIIPLGQRALQ